MSREPSVSFKRIAGVEQYPDDNDEMHTVCGNKIKFGAHFIFNQDMVKRKG